MRKFIVGDIHGCLDLFNEVLEVTEFDFNNDIMYSVGDLIDRGPDSMKCLRLLKEPWFHAVRGNHEDLMIESVFNFYNTNLWIMNGGGWHLDVDKEELKELAELARQLPYAITIGDIGICHAEPPTTDWNNVINPSPYNKEKMIWGRNRLYKKLVTENIKTTYHGHTIVDNITYAGNAVFIDTGAFHTGILTCVEI